MHFAFSANTLCLLATASQLLSSALAHSWPEALNLINTQGTIYGPTGYVRNFVPRNSTGFQGSEDDSFQKTQVVQGAKTCMDRQTQQVQSPGYPRLAVNPGSRVALRYAENGHVTIEQTGRPPQGGPVYIYGTTDGTTNPLLTDVMAWNSQGSGGNGQGKLLMTQNFDDGRCYEINSSPKEQARAAANPLNGALALPDFSGLPCQNDFVVPTDAPTGKPYTIYWVWNFTMVDPPGQGVELYSDCLDFDVSSASSSAAGGAAANANKGLATAATPQAYNIQQAPISAAVSTYFNALAANAATASTTPAATPTAASSPAMSPSAASPSAASPPAAAPSAAPAIASEPSTGGGIFAPPASTEPAAASPGTPAGGAAPGPTATVVVTVQPSPVMQTVYVTVGAGPASAAAPAPQPTPAAQQSATPPAVAQPSVAASPSAAISPPAATSPSTAAAQPSAVASPPAANPSPQSANGMAIPVIAVPSAGPAAGPSAASSAGPSAALGSPSAASPIASAVASAAASPIASPIASPVASPAVSANAQAAPKHAATASGTAGSPAATSPAAACKNKRLVKSRIFANLEAVKRSEQEIQEELQHQEVAQQDADEQLEQELQMKREQLHGRPDAKRFKRWVRF